MNNKNTLGLIVLGIFIFLGLSFAGYTLGNSFLKIKEMNRTVSVKGLAEREVKADIVLWPIDFRVTGNNLEELYNSLEDSSNKIVEFLEKNGISKDEITISAPSIEDKALYQEESKLNFRYVATETVTVYSSKVDLVYNLTSKIGELVKENVAINNNQYGNGVDYLYTGLNSIKPSMIEEATTNAREVAEKFAKDSKSSLGKIKSANQGQFVIENRDQHNPQIKKVRVVSTVEYYLVD
ncbi:SIMPL domain-containing protein [Cetobacterium sp. SF1]|uniref:SIMPL domain-containing protein n=1 Tax=unclassified Cetobacterium TaxID=2630983 RepID=UPI003CF8A192